MTQPARAVGQAHNPTVKVEDIRNRTPEAEHASGTGTAHDATVVVKERE